ncbi:serine hydrolase domain-containing protein [Pedobacter insulae]|uniref:CubicO group peptidase, beta-lactamase class C family n=1 Tax=Pedobacter insulae TaxID=414048 RepID=A0A1I2XIK1_9SPHI|nr:serine hydrolase domain-containing protein [Pedobacter insulae]SFH13313.1 CubicO group peptidase, beta-lactamase class C family [Pedobacter insulae]
MLKYLKSGYAILLCTIISISPFNVAIAQNFETTVDSLLSTVVHDKTGPGMALLVAKNGIPIYQKAFGKTNIEVDADIGINSVFQIGSMTKQFTAIAIMMLEEQGRLNVNDPISRYLPDYPVGNKITIHHLLTHTAGIKDFTTMKSIDRIARSDLSPKELINFFKNEPVDFAPGDKFEYNNSGYVILGYLIEQISGETYESFVQRNIFNKAKMYDSRYASDRKIVMNRASGYDKKETGYVNKTSISFAIPFSAGSLMSTTADLLKWQNALNQNLFVKAGTMKKVTSQYKLNNGTLLTYGYGWHLKNINGISTREHGGSIFGFKSMAVYIPSRDIYVVGLSNCSCNSPTQVTREIAALALQRLR